MRLDTLLEGLAISGLPGDVEISGVTADSRQVEPGMLFVCIKGLKSDGHQYAKKALEAGAAAIVCERDMGLERQLMTPDTRYAYGVLCANWYGNPARRLKMVGVTGTNGKTTVTYMLKHILSSAGKKTGLIGTIHNEIDDITLPAKHTTPDPLALHGMLDRMEKAGCEYVVMECSSHALDQQRLTGVHYDVVAFTNLTQDHLDYHGTMEHYYEAKKKLFSMCDTAVINFDDPYGKQLLKEFSEKALSFSIESDVADYTAREIRYEADASRFMLLGKGQIARVHLHIPGAFSVANAMTAAGVCLALGLTFEQVAQGLDSCPGVVGRAEVLQTDTPFTVIRDYAHSPDGLEKIITTMKPFAKGRVITLFGCAGNRDRGKRRLMSEIVARHSDFVILTSDNPRDEDEMQIIEDAMPGIEEHPETPYKVIPDRYAAIEWALANAQPDDVLILAGKGHEDYQVLRGQTIYFDEKKIVEDILSRRKK